MTETDRIAGGADAPPSIDQVAAMNLHYVFYPLRRFLDAVEAAGIANVDLWGGMPHMYAEDATPSEVKGVRDEIRRRGLRLVCFTPEQCIYPVNIAAAEATTRTRSIQYFRKNLDIAADLEVGQVLVTSGWGYRSETIAAAWSRSRDGLSELADMARERGLTLLLEHLQPTESNLVVDLPTTIAMVSEVGAGNLAVCVDTVAMTVAGETLDDWYTAFGPRLARIHLNDGNPTGHLAWGDGTLPLDDYVAALRKHRYEGGISLEIAASRYFTDPDAATRTGISTLRSALVRGGVAGAGLPPRRRLSD